MAAEKRNVGLPSADPLRGCELNPKRIHPFTPDPSPTEQLQTLLLGSSFSWGRHRNPRAGGVPIPAGCQGYLGTCVPQESRLEEGKVRQVGKKQSFLSLQKLHRASLPGRCGSGACHCAVTAPGDTLSGVESRFLHIPELSYIKPWKYRMKEAWKSS